MTIHEKINIKSHYAGWIIERIRIPYNKSIKISEDHENICKIPWYGSNLTSKKTRFYDKF